jgi:MFS superfamily sulfate permease-like transporter
VVTWLGVIIFNVDYGLYIAMVVSLSMIIFQNQRAVASVMGNIPKTNIYEGIKKLDQNYYNSILKY